MGELLAYADSEDEGQSAMDMELGALAAARQIVGPILEQKLQKRLDALDRGKKKPDVENAKGRSSRTGGAGGSGKAS
jgi:hypothetical protein